MMHHDEIPSDADLVRRLLIAQQPQWADLPIRPVTSTGTSNAMYRLGADMVVRLALRPSSARSVEKEHRWLPILAPHLPVTIPVPLALGEASDEFPVRWSVCPWIEGEDATTAAYERVQAARDVAAFINALSSLDTAGAPEPNAATYGRGVPLATRDVYTRDGIASCAHLVDAAALTAVWDRALHAPVWDRRSVWVHGDIASGNLLFRNGRLSAVIDFASLGVGDPACDLIVAWEMFDVEARAVLRSELGVDDATWDRGRGWALSTAVAALGYYEHTHRFMADQARRKIDLILAE
jgi:aminoglycoside phosphotransferase (APT) family kinase protein